MRTRMRTAAAVAVAALGLLLLTAGGAAAYEPVQQNMYVPTNPASCNKKPCVLYPKSAQLSSGRLVAAFEDDESAVVGQTMPIYKSDDNGATWQKLLNLKAPAYLSSNTAYSAYTSAWTNPFLYVLPQALGSLPAGTLMLASVVSGVDTEPNPSGNGNRQNVAIVLESSSDQGATWTVRSTIVTGANQKYDPVWEPYLMMYQGKLVVYYSDEEEKNFYSTADQATHEGGQILAHKTSTDGVTWSTATADVGTSFYSGRPGMTNMVPTTDGKWLMTFEYWGGGANTRIKVCNDPLNCNPTDAGTAAPASGGSPVMTTLPDGRIVYNAAGSSDVFVNTTGASTGAWTAVRTAVAAGYSRHLQYVSGTRRVLILSANWGSSGSVGPVRYGEADLGNSAGAYYKLINRASGQALSVDGASLADGTAVIQWGDHNGGDQLWHVTTLANGNKVIGGNKSSGRALGISQAATTDGAKAVQWVENGSTDQQWKLVTTGSYVKLLNANSGKALGILNASTAQGAQVVQWTDTGATNQQWQLVQVSS